MVTEILHDIAIKGIHLYLKDGRLAFKAPKDALTPELQKKISENKDKIIQFLENQNTNISLAGKIQKVSNESGSFLLSFAQQRLWLLDQIDDGSAHYNMPYVLRLTGVLNEKIVAQAFTTVVERHESLRTRFAADENGQPIQIIQATVPFVVPMIDLSGLDEDESQLKISGYISEEASRLFDLSSDLMLRAQLIKVTTDEHILLVTMHHIASDGWSMSVLINEFRILYSAYAQGQENPLPPVVIQYADYAHWQRNWLQGEALDRQLGYWEKQLASLPVIHSLPLDCPRPPIQSFVGKTHKTQVELSTSKLLNSLCQSEGTTLFMGLHAAFSVLLSRYSNETDIVVGSPIANREQAEIAGLIGFFVNTLVLRSDLSNSPSFTALINQSKTMLMDAYAHQQVPFEQIVERLQPERNLSHSALFQVMLVLQNNEQGILELPGLTLSPVEQTGTIAKYDLTLTMVENENGIGLSWEYNTDLFEQKTISQMANHFGLLLTALVAKPEQNVFNVDMLDVQERQQLLVDWNNTQVDYPNDKCIHGLFEAQVETNPDAIAVTFENQELTYEQLNQKANQLAHYLINEKHVTPDTLVGICVERSLEMVVGILAILKAGGAYVPLDPEYPEARLKYMLDDAQLTTVLTQSHLRETTPVSDSQAVCLDSAEIQQQLQTQSIQNPNAKELGESGLTSNNLAYVIYTSGSTGNPKGVLVEHYNITRLLDSAREDFEFNEQDVWTLFHSYAFDFSVWEIWGALAQGGRLVVVPYWVSRSPSDFYQLLSAEGVTVLNQTPSAFTMLVQEDAVQNTPLSLRYVVFGGEALNLASLLPWFTRHGDNQPQLINMYGITETTVHVTYRRITQDLAANASGASLIGKPLSDLQLVVLNDQQRLVPVGVAGEMYVGGAGVTRGYLNQPELTQSRFVSLPDVGGKVFYRTGDLARYLSNGELEYLGRIDHQVKIRGFRIELGEIESALASHELVKDAIVLAKASATGTGDKRLVAYVVTGAADLQNDTDVTISARHELIEQLRQHLGQTLPDYMVPSAFVLLESLPLTTNGKVDRKALPEPDFAAQQNTYVAPTTETEKILCNIWQEVLGVERVGITDNFFQLGGHSLLATRLVARINQTFNVALPLKSLFNAQALGSLAQAILQLDTSLARPALTSIPRDGVLLASYSQQRLWLLDQIDGGSAHYNMPAALKLAGELNTSALQQAFTTIFERHESLRTCFVVGEDGQPIQVIQEAVPFVVPVVDLSTLEESARQLQLTQIISDEVNTGFDLSTDLMLRAQLIKITADEHIVLVTMHHIASDGWSMSILINEFSALYSAYAQGNENPLAPLAIQYADYAHWQRNWLQGEVLDQQLGYWKKQLASLPVAHSLPLDHARPQMQTFAGANYSSLIDAETSKTLAALCQAQGATLFMGLHAAFSVLLSRYSNETDIVVGSPIANREQAEIAGLIGFFVNTLVLRSDLSNSLSFTALINQSKTMLLDAYAHQQVPFEQIVERLQPERNLSHSALFQVMLVLQNNEQGILELPGLTLSPVEQSGVIAKYDLTLNVIESAGELQLGWEYNTDLFEQQTIARMANHFGLLLTALVAKPEQNVFNVDMLDAQERQQLLVDWNNTQVDYPNDKCIHELFEAQVETNPDAIAVTFENQTLSYQQLNEKANQLAHYLINEKQIKPDTLVGICVERSLEMVVGILAILKSGGAYVPLDPEYPEARLKYMLDDAQLTTVLTQSHLRETTPVSDAQAVCLDSAEIQQQLQTQSIQNPNVKELGESGLTSNNLAYVIYTSGSTGNPKGVLVEHYNITRLLDSAREDFEFNEQDVWTLFHSYAFDFSVWEIWGALAQGGRLVVVPYWVSRSPSDFYQLLSAEGVTVLNQTPSAFTMLVQEDAVQNTPLSLRYVVFGGEALNLASLLPWFTRHGDNQPQLINMYGITETTVHVTYRRITQDLAANASGASLIGKPLSDLQLVVLNDQQRLVPVGVAGEMYVGGAGVTRGYLNQPALTQSRFVSLSEMGGKVFYRTGDLARYLPNGELEYLGRIDHQVKIRGFRIELGEIESALASHELVKDAIVLAKASATGTGDKRLVAYVVTGAADLQNDTDITISARHELIEQLRQHLGQTLPDYMVPSAFVLLESLPLTTNGKVDRKALPEPDFAAQQNTYVAPTTETEKILCNIWQEVLGVERVGITDNFFQLGGHSLLIMQVIARLQQQGLVMTARELFTAPSLGDLAIALDTSGNHGQPLFKAPANLIPESCTSITPDMLPLVDLSSAEIVHITGQVPGGVANVQDIYPLGPLQEGILFQHMMATQGDAYVLPTLFKMDNRKVVTDFIEALQFIVNRHDALRTAIIWQGLSVPVQVVCRHAELPITWLELDVSETIEAQMRTRCEPGKQWMDLGQAPLLQVQIAVDSESQQHFVLLQYHHIISDHVGLEIIQKEFALYQAGQSDNLPAAVPYREFVAHAQHRALHNDATAFFTQTLGDVEEPTVPFDVHDTNGDGNRIVEARAGVPVSVSSQLRLLANNMQVSPAALFHTAWAMVIAACSGRNDVVFGTVMSGRLQGTVGAEHMLGVFINTLPLRVKLHNASVIDAVRNVQDSLLDLLPYEQSSLALAQRCSALPAGSPLFTAMFNYRHSVVEIGDATNNVGFEFLAGQERTNYPLTLSVDDFGDAFGLDIQVDQSIRAERVLDYMQAAIAELAKALSSAPEQPITALSILPEQERQQLLVDWNNTQVDYPNDKCIHELFEAQVETNPDAIAVTFENQTLSYQQLNEKANQLAHYLINEKQIKPDTLVGICVERSLEMVVGILAILKAGGAYVPLDPEYPEVRLKYMLDDAQLTTVLTQSHLRETTPVSDAQAVCLDSAEIQQQLQTQSIQNPHANELGLNLNHLAYVIYTSGSTGNPKGVLVEHQSILNLAFNIQEMGLCGVGQAWGWNASYAFDASLQAITQLMLGSRLQIISEQCRRDPSLLANVLDSLDAIDCTPMMAEAWFAAGIGHQLPNLILGGEPITPKLWSVLVEWQQQYNKKAINVYGPTECTVDSTGCVIKGVLSHIGKALPNTTLYVMNPSGQLVGKGLAGELHIGGVGLARGYLNRADLTAEQFIANPFYDKTNLASSERLYKTGDLVRWLPDGNLEYLGRIDHQVKIRGFRIELGEIENTLSSHVAVTDAVVLAKESPATGDKRLVAYVVTEQQDNPELVEQLRQHLSQTLPDYMVPSAFVLLESLPLTTNGKVDRKALPEPDFAAQQNTYVAPTTETEKILCNIWQDVLGVERVGITDNFFQLGGHSLLATRLVARINQTFNVALPLKSLFNAQALGSLAQAILQLDTSLARPELVNVSRDNDLLASYSQQRLWLLDQIDGGSAHYNMPAALKLVGELNTSALQHAFTSILERHESLRTCFVVGEDGQPIQVIQAAVPFVVPVVDLSTLEESARELQLTQIISDEATTGFELSTDLMLRAQLIKITADKHIVLVTMHHIASDGWSMSILINEFSALYSAYAQGNENPLAPLTIQYADYAHWQRNWLQGEVLDQQLGYWAKQLTSLPVAHSLPLDHARPQMQTFAGVNYSSHIDAETSKTLAALCQAQGATLFMGLHAAFSVLLSRYSNETDIVVGSPIANREQAEIAGLIGFFVNTLVLRSDLSENPSFTNLLNQSKTMLLDAYAHQQVPFEQIVERLQPERNLSHSALFQVMLVLQNNEQGILELPGLTLSPVEQTGTIAKYDLTLTAIETLSGLQLGWEYNTDLFEQKTIAQMANHFGLLLTALVAKPEQNVFNVDMLDVQERQQLLVDWNNTQVDYPNDKCIHELFEAQVETNPDAIAVTFENQELTYEQLNQKANQLAHYLINEKHIKPDTLVGICVERSLEMVVGILAILKAGGAYVPLDPEYPEARLKYMLDDAQLTTVLTQSHLRETTPVSDAQAVCLDSAEIQQQLQTQSIQNPHANELGLNLNHLAYVIYTSGSTGNPKGVLVEHQSILNLAFYIQEMGLCGVGQAWGWNASYAFDASLQAITQLMLGSRLQIISEQCRRDPSLLANVLDSLDAIDCTPMMAEAWFAAGIGHQLPNLILGGEPITPKLWSVLVEWEQQYNKKAINVYGPTECTVDSTGCVIEGVLPHIGKALPNTTLYVMNPSGHLVGKGLAGELHIGGVGLARGYLNRADLTAEQFIANPFYDKTNLASSERLYKTGDLVRWLPDGNLEYLGRIDHQVKIRGFRIELGEIENTLSSHVAVTDAVVLAKESPATGDKRLVAYVVTEQQDNPELVEQLRQHLSQTLPDYMVPSAFVLLESLPLTTNGKVDRKALPEPDFAAQQNTYVAPTTETEKILCNIWQDVLGVERVGITDNFFQLGGHSLLATRLVARINQTFNVTLPLKSLFNAQALGSLAQAILQLDTTLARPALTSVPRDGVLLASYTQQRLWLLDQIDGGSAHYNMPAALKLAGELNTAALQHAFTTIFERHESLRTCFAVGEDGQPIQVIQDAVAFYIPLIDLSNFEESARESQLTQIISDEANTGFDLSTDLMLRAQLIKITADEYTVLVTMHHIASDGWSMSILINEFSALYSAYAQGNENPLAPLTIQYADYAHWQRNWLQGEVLDQQLGYWAKQLASLPVAHSLPLDHARPQMQMFAGADYSSHIDAETSKTLAALCQAQGATLFMGLHAAFSVLLSRYSNETDIVVGSPIANREQAEIAGLIGFFVNTLVLRSDLSESPNFTNLLNQSKTMLLDAYAHQQVPFEQIVERLQPERNLSHSALFQVMLVLQNNEQGILELPGLTLSPVEQTGTIAKYDLTLTMVENENGIGLSWEYNTDLFEQQTIARMANHFGLLLTALVAKPEQNVFNVDMLDAQERQQLLVDWNNTQVDYPNDKCIHELFETQVETNPDAVAVTFENQTLSYQQLNEKANQLAHYLINEKQIKPDTLVGICVERSLEMVVGILAILKAGGAYVPLDPEYPEARLKYMLDDAQLTTVLTQSHLRETTPVSDSQAVCLDSAEIQQQLQTQSIQNPNAKELGESGLTSNNLAYVIYTSGSTGNPKGVLVEHYNITRLLDSAREDFEFNQQDVWTLFHSYAFDFSVWEIWGALAQGGRLVVVPYWVSRSPSDFYQLLSAEGVTVLNQTPSAFTMLVQEDAVQNTPLSLRYVVFGGEALNLATLLPWFTRHGDNQPQLINMYGITETTVHVTYRRITQDLAANASGASLIGKPLSDLQLVVLNDQQRLVPVGVAGEMYVGGAGVTRGYLNQPALTQSRFVSLSEMGGKVFYRTGDLARYLPNGELEYLGRIDHQVKIRGFRIELGEIESALASHELVKDAIVLAKASATGTGDKRLVAYVVTGQQDNPDENTSEFVEQLRQHLGQTLPDYMVPSAFVLLESLPLTTNGKVDRKALPEPDFAAQQNTYVAPTTETEKILCNIWQEVLGVERVGITDNFFQLGGHSLLVIKTLSQVNEVFSINIAMQSLFNAQTISVLSEIILKNISIQHNKNMANSSPLEEMEW